MERPPTVMDVEAAVPEGVIPQPASQATAGNRKNRTELTPSMKVDLVKARQSEATDEYVIQSSPSEAKQ